MSNIKPIKINPELFAPDMIVVLDKGYYLCKNDGWTYPIQSKEFYINWEGSSDENLVGMYNYLNNLIAIHNKLFRHLEIFKYFE